MLAFLLSILAPDATFDAPVRMGASGVGYATVVSGHALDVHATCEGTFRASIASPFLAPGSVVRISGRMPSGTYHCFVHATGGDVAIVVIEP